MIAPDTVTGMTVTKSLLLFALAAIAEIGGAWLVWQGVREHRGWLWIGAGFIAFGLYGLVATMQPEANFGRILAALPSSCTPRGPPETGHARSRASARLTRPAGRALAR